MYEYIRLIHLAVQKKLANQPNQHEATSSNKKGERKVSQRTLGTGSNNTALTVTVINSIALAVTVSSQICDLHCRL